MIQVDGLSKCYKVPIVQSGAASPMLRTEVTRLLRRIFRRSQAPSERSFWALQDVSFEVEEGEVLGIIGHNGAGKSTLLKILCRVTQPTTGHAQLRGRVGSMLEVGTGFHPELSGRENIFLNGAILGMRRREILAKFDEIVSFSGVSDFLEMPVKRYSSGMYVRLAFAIAAHLEPEILLVDEVLTVGDLEFRRKCLGRMGAVAREGRTILLVSHNMAAIQSTCHRAVLLNRGRVELIGEPKAAIDRYLESSGTQGLDFAARQEWIGSGEARIVGFELRDLEGNHLDAVVSGQDVDIYLHINRGDMKVDWVPKVTWQVKTSLDVPLIAHENQLSGDLFTELPPHCSFVCRVRRLPLMPGNYRLSFLLTGPHGVVDSLSNAAELMVEAGAYYETGILPSSMTSLCLVDGRWRQEPRTPEHGPDT